MAYIQNIKRDLYKIHFLLYKKNIFTVFKSKKIFIISVGNLVVGGAGKTPFVALLSDAMYKKNLQHCVVSRGYKKKLPGEIG